MLIVTVTTLAVQSVIFVKNQITSPSIFRIDGALRNYIIWSKQMTIKSVGSLSKFHKTNLFHKIRFLLRLTWQTLRFCFYDK